MRKAIISTLMASMMFTVVPQNSFAAETSKLDYVALGDSLAAGQTPYYKWDDGYPEYIARQLEAIGVLQSFEDRYAVSGYTTTDVLNDLTLNIKKDLPNSVDAKGIRQSIKDAEIITLDIGANDLLKSLKLKEGFALDEESIKGALVQIQTNIVKILQELKTLNPTAEVYVMGYYNALPYLPDAQQSLLIPMLNQANLFIQLAAEQFGYTFVPTFNVISKDHLPNSLDVHLNLEGYRLIANEFWKKMNVKPVPTFTDFNENSPNFKEVSSLVQKGILNGYQDGSLGLDKTLKRIHAVNMLNRAIIFEESQLEKLPFKDVVQGIEDYENIARLVEKKIVSGSNGLFMPYKELTKAQAAKIIVEAFGKNVEDTSDMPMFEDLAKDHWAFDYVAVLYQEGLITDDSEKFSPNKPIAREEFALWLAKMMEN